MDAPFRGLLLHCFYEEDIPWRRGDAGLEIQHMRRRGFWNEGMMPVEGGDEKVGHEPEEKMELRAKSLRSAGM
jgi:hypothetical protein